MTASEGLDSRIYSFTPNVSGYYKLHIYDYQEGIPHIALFDSDYNYIGRCGVYHMGQIRSLDSKDREFFYEAYLEAGRTYYFAQALCAETDNEIYSFILTYSPSATMTNTDIPYSDDLLLSEDVEETAHPSIDPSGEISNGGSSPAAPTSNPAPTDAPVISSRNYSIGDFVERLYTVALGRNSDPVGKQDWIDAVTLRGQTGADLARGFLYSPEFLEKNVSNEDFVRTLYRTFFDREADADGLSGWVAVLDNGGSKEGVIEGFINSTEWANLCLLYGVRSGGTGTPNVQVEPNQATIDFATRLYTTCLSRSADDNGLMAWARQLANQRDTGTGAARGFFFSTEFTNQNVSNGEYVTRLYRTFMGREPDEAGFNAWVGQLDSGVSREDVFDGFAASQEFGVICSQYGILR
ncbi:MAG: DUF4214 domain-containing protein [Lachnospiraceae bacterium]|nr:DUF4214 domain-containing protein [Lachnospiraceae bacterium]